jgi:hypothetical protein
MKNVLYCVVCLVALAFVSPVFGGSVGNPNPGFPHDTIMIHVQKADSGPKQCDGGHSLFLRQQDGVVLPAQINITMVDWNQVDDDGDGVPDDDPFDGIDNDGDGLDGEDPVEPGAITKALDCDAWGDGEVSLLIRDTEPDPGVISTHGRWAGRKTRAELPANCDQTVSCNRPRTGYDYGTNDDFVECVSGLTRTEWSVWRFRSQQTVASNESSWVAGSRRRQPFCDIRTAFRLRIQSTLWRQLASTQRHVSWRTSSSSAQLCGQPVSLDETLYCP